MIENIKHLCLCSITFLLCMVPIGAQTLNLTPATLTAEIDSLKAPKVAWRQISWKTCLLDGLKEAKSANKPALLWIFIDRPTDDARC